VKHTLSPKVSSRMHAYDRTSVHSARAGFSSRVSRLSIQKEQQNGVQELHFKGSPCFTRILILLILPKF
jgi:hypothetical protein